MNEITKTIIEQLGGRGLTGALTYAGCSKITELDDYTASFTVNGKEDVTTIMHVHLSPQDLYDIYVREVKDGEIKYRSETNDVYGEDLQATFEDTYDNYINVRNDGFINI